MRFIPTKFHAPLDYIVGAALIAAPWIFQFSEHTAATIVPIVLEEMRHLGAAKRRVRAKIAGGASMFANLMTTNAINIGERNVASVRSVLAAAKVPIVGEDVGSDHGRSVYLFLGDGRVEVRSLRKGLRVL
jgi:chemotaxis protein CheD